MSEGQPIAAPVAWWRHPGALAAAHLHRALFGAVAVLPLAAWVATLLGERAGVDATLLDHGGLLVPDVTRALRDARRSLVAGPTLALGLGVLTGLATTAGWLDAMARPGARPLGDRVGAAALAVPPLLLGAFVSLVLQVAVGWLVGGAGVAVVDALHLAEPAHDGAMVLVVAVAIGTAATVRVGSDLFAAASVGRGAPIGEAASIALAALRARPVGLWSAHASRAVTALALLASAVLGAIRLGMREPGDAALALVALEAALLAGTALRGSWLAVALAAVRDVSGGGEAPSVTQRTDPSTPPLPDGVDSSKKSPLLAAEVEDAPR